MTDYINILKEQVEEGRRSGLSSAHESSSTRQSIQKKKLIPLENPELNKSTNQTISKTEEKTNSNRKSTSDKSQKFNKPVYKEVSTEPDQTDITKPRPQLTTVSTDPIASDINEDDQNDISQNNQTGGALWDAPKEFQDIRSSMKSLPKAPQQPEKKPCLFDLVMQPPKKELQPTLFTYFDKLMQMGEV